MEKHNIMPIAGYYGPYRLVDESTDISYDLVNEAVYEKIKDAGINLIVRCDNDYEAQPQIILDNLVLAEKYGVGLFVTDSRTKNPTGDCNLQDYFKDYDQYSSFKGIYIIDEPCSEGYYPAAQWEKGERRIADYAKQSSKINACEDYIGYTNLYPMYDFMARKHDIDTDYRAYLQEYLDTYNPKLISYDHYPFDHYLHPENLGLDIAGVHQVYFRNLSVVRELALEKGIPFWSYVQAGANWNDDVKHDLETVNDTPTKSQMLWNINTALAYGAKGIQYFPLVQPYFFAYSKNGQPDYGRNGILGADGEPTMWYEYAKYANQLIAIVDEVLMNATSERVLAIGEKAQTETKITESSFGKLQRVSATNGALIGVFQYQDTTAYYVVNYDMDMTDKATITLEFDEAQTFSVLSREITTTDSGQTLCTLFLEAGDAALVVIQ